MMRTLLALLRRSASKPAAISTGYREPAEQIAHDALRDIEAETVTMQRRIRVLERQLQEAGIEPSPTPRGRDLLLVAQVLDQLAGGPDAPSINTLQAASLATTIRGLAQWDEE